MTIERFASESPFEDVVGYSRVVRAGPLAFVAGTTAADADGVVLGGESVYEQAAEALRRIAAALAGASAGLADVVQTRIYLTDLARWREAGRAHAEAFGDVRPVSTMVEVAALIDPRMLVEIEAVAYVEPR